MDLTPEQADAHNALFAAGMAILKAHAFMDGRPEKGPPGFFARWRLKKGIRLFTGALRISPDNWPSMWSLGKLHQRLGDNATALRWFVEAHRLKPDQRDVLREAGIAALDVGAKDEALKYCLAAVCLAPDDPGLQANLALAHLLAGDDGRAEECARVASSRDPRDEVSRAVAELVRDVRQGKKPRPQRLGNP